MDFRIYDKDAIHGQVTQIACTGNFLAIGYSSGTILVYNLERVLDEDDDPLGKVTESRFELLYQFSFHKSAVTAMVFAQDNT